MIDEGPSSEDIDHFDRDTAYCPDCGAEVWDEAEVCPKCHSFIGGQTLTRKPIQKWVDRRMALLVVIALLIAFGFIWLMSLPAGY